MGGYIIAQDSRASQLSCYLNDARRGRRGEGDSHFDIEQEAPRGILYPSLRAEVEEKSTNAASASPHIAGEFKGYDQLLPNIARGAFFLVEEDGALDKERFSKSSTNSNSQSRQRQISHIRPNSTSRIHKPRRISPNTSAEPLRTLEHHQRPDVPKTPMSWSTEDDILLRDLKELKKLGWKEISAYFPKRTAHACQFRWRRLVSGTLKGHKQTPPLPSNRMAMPCLPIPLDQAITGKNIWSFDDSGATKLGRFGSTSPGIDSNGSAKSPTISPPSSPNYASESSQLNIHEKSATLSSGSGSVKHCCGASACSGVGQENPNCAQVLSGAEANRVESSAFHDGLFDRQSFYSPLSMKQERATQKSFPVSNQSNNSDCGTGILRCERVSWTSEEDSLLLNRRLSFDEVSILLHHRSEEAIWSRMGLLRSAMPKFPNLECKS